MKRVFVSSMYLAPRDGNKGGNSNGKKIETTSNEPAKDDAPKEGSQPNETSEMSDDGSTKNEGGEGEKPPVEEPTSEKLISLNAELDVKMTAFATEKDKKTRLKMLGEMQKLQSDIETEKNAIKRQIAEEALRQKQNARIALFDTAEKTIIDEYIFRTTVYDVTPEVEFTDEAGIVTMRKPQDVTDQMNAFTDAKKAAREVVVNELLGKSPKVGTPSKDKEPGEGGEKGETSKKIIALYEQYLADGLSDTDARKKIINENEMSRGTTGAVVLAYRREKGLTD